MLYYKSNEEIEIIRESSLIVAKTLAEVAKVIAPGVKTIKLDSIAEEFIMDAGAKPAFKGYNGFSHTLCISVNAQVVHGIPGDYELREGDIVSVDCGVLKNGFYGDSAYTFAIEGIKPEALHLLKTTKEALQRGIEMAVEGKRLGDISSAIQEYTEKNKFSVVRELVGHGIGKNLHESPEVPNYGRKGTGIKLREGIVIAIEPMINMGKKEVVQENDGWTVRTADNMFSAHFEHTVAVKKGSADVLSSFAYIEEVIKARPLILANIA